MKSNSLHDSERVERLQHRCKSYRDTSEWRRENKSPSVRNNEAFDAHKPQLGHINVCVPTPGIFCLFTMGQETSIDLAINHVRFSN